MMIITTSDHAEEVIGNIMEEKNWDLWITSVAVVDKDMTGWLINEIPVVAHSYRSIFEYAMRSVVDEVFLYIPMDDEFPIAMTGQECILTCLYGRMERIFSLILRMILESVRRLFTSWLELWNMQMRCA